MPKNKIGNNIKLVEEVSRRKVELIIYASYYCGFMASTEEKRITNPDCLSEIHNLIEMIRKEI